VASGQERHSLKLLECWYVSANSTGLVDKKQTFSPQKDNTVNPRRILSVCLSLLFTLLLMVSSAIAQEANARISGLITDPSKAVITEVNVVAINVDTNVRFPAKTNGSGVYVLPALPIGDYRVEVEHVGFKSIVEPGIILHVQDALELNFEMALGSASETVTVNGSGVNVDTTDGTVSTVIDRDLIENMPLNGKDMTTLFELSPGTILNSGGTPGGGGGFSVDGQRPTSNYLTIDGVSGNTYMPTEVSLGNITGASIAVSASGGTNGILPIDAIEEYRMDTSTYTAENGRTPGGQIQVRTRSGTNQFHGTLFENFRNQVLDATDWFVKYDGLKQSPLRMNDFGGTLGGPVLKNKVFFFVAHDSLLLNQPNTVSHVPVPSQSTVQSAYSAFQPWLGIFPNGNGGADPSDPAFNFFNASEPYEIRDHTTSLRADAQLPRSIHAFFRANIAPSSDYQFSYNGMEYQENIYTYTGGVTVPLGSHIVNDLTLNESQTHSSSSYLDLSIGGNNPNALSGNFPTGVMKTSTTDFCYSIYDSSFAVDQEACTGPSTLNQLNQWNLVDKLSWVKGKHSLSFGGDLLLKAASVKEETDYYYVGTYVTDLTAGNVSYALRYHFNAQPITSIRNLSLYANDDWRITPTLRLNAGLRWEYNPAPSVGPLGVLAIEGSSLNPATIQAAVTTAPLYNTAYDNLAPRLGFAWTAPAIRRMQTVVRGGAGIYFDTGQAGAASEASRIAYPYLSQGSIGTSTPYQSISFPNIPLTPAAGFPTRYIYLVDPSLATPRTYDWSLTIEQQYGTDTKVSLSYIGNDGEELAGIHQYANIPNAQGAYPVNTNFLSAYGDLEIFGSYTHSNYQAFQSQATVRVGSQVNAVASYTFAHAEDNGATVFSTVGALAPNPMANSANDMRHIFAAAVSYAPKFAMSNRFMRAITDGWGFDTIARLQTATPFTVIVSDPQPNSFSANADAVVGVPTVLHEHVDSFGKVVPGNKLLNWAAFTAPPSSNGTPLRQGDSPTNGYRLFGLTQWDLAASRSWPVREGVGLTFRIDAFNLLNIANFAPPSNSWSTSNQSTFGRALNTYSGGYGGSAAAAGQQGQQLAVFQNGGPREVELSMKLKF
jgi:Carboxypeptidase regulatory-like domain/TonB dependent receptor